MEKMNDLQDLLKHEIEDLVSAEDQIIEALPAMIEKASDRKLKDALRQHLKITQQQRKRLDQVQKAMNGGADNKEESGLLQRWFSTKHHCKGMAGIIEEGEKIMAEDIDPDVMDAAIIGAAQKVEHYEICGYGTARAYAEELGMKEVERLLMQTLNEEKQADVLLTEMAVGRLNREAENAGNDEPGSGRRASSTRGSSGGKKTGSATKKQSASGRTASKKQSSSSPAKKSGSSASKSSGKSTASKKSASKSGSKSASKSSSRRTASKSRR